MLRRTARTHQRAEQVGKSGWGEEADAEQRGKSSGTGWRRGKRQPPGPEWPDLALGGEAEPTRVGPA